MKPQLSNHPPAPGWWGLEPQAPEWGLGWATLQGPFILTWRFLGDKGWPAGALGCPSPVGRGLWGAGLLQRVKSGPLPGVHGGLEGCVGNLWAPAVVRD